MRKCSGKRWRRIRSRCKGHSHTGCPGNESFQRKRGRSFTVELPPRRSGFVGGNYLCEGSKERWLQAARVVVNMHGSIVRRHTGKTLGHREIACNGEACRSACLPALRGTQSDAIQQRLLTSAHCSAYQGHLRAGVSCPPGTRKAKASGGFLWLFKQSRKDFTV